MSQLQEDCRSVRFLTLIIMFIYIGFFGGATTLDYNDVMAQTSSLLLAIGWTFSMPYRLEYIYESFLEKEMRGREVP